MNSPADLLIVKPSSLGDIVHTLPAVALVKHHWPQARLRWLINPEWAPLLEGNPHVDAVVPFPRGQFRGLAGGLRIPAWAKMMRQQRVDLVLDFQGLLRSALISRLCRGGEIVGLSDAREGARFFYDRVADVRHIAHAVDRYLRLVATLGIDPSAPLEWPLPAGQAPAGFAPTEPFAVLHPFSRGQGKSLSPSEVTRLCAALAPLRVILVGRIAEAPTALPDNTTNLLNRTSLAELIWLLRHAAFTISVDSGPMHIAAALPPDLIAIHTWSDPAKVGPYRPDAWIWQDGRLFQKRDLAQPAGHRPCPDLAALAAFALAAFTGPPGSR